MIPTLFSASVPLGHYLDILLLIRQWSMLHQNVPGGKVLVFTELLSQAVGAFVQALQLLQLLTSHLHGGKRRRCPGGCSVPPQQWLLPWPCPHLPVLQVLNVSSVVAVPVPTAQHPEPPPADGVHQGPAIRQQLDLPYLQHAAVVSKTGGRQGEKRGVSCGTSGERDALLKAPPSKDGKTQELAGRRGKFWSYHLLLKGQGIVSTLPALRWICHIAKGLKSSYCPDVLWP